MGGKIVEADQSKHDLRDIATVFILSLVTVLTAWCGYESARWGSEMSIASSQTSALRGQASDAAGEARDWRAFDLAVYISWVEASGRGDTKLADYGKQRFSPWLRKSFAKWQADGRKEASPLSHVSYVPPGAKEAARLTARAEARFNKGLDSGTKGDHYSLLTVLFAMALFFVALSERGRTEWASRALLTLGAIVAITGVVLLVTFPIKM